MSIISCQGLFFFLMIRRPPRSTHCISSAASDVYKRQVHGGEGEALVDQEGGGCNEIKYDQRSTHCGNELDVGICRLIKLVKLQAQGLKKQDMKRGTLIMLIVCLLMSFASTMFCNGQKNGYDDLYDFRLQQQSGVK
eukprot:TRINITY_DN11885_c0_g1_i1.p4 TRINITY_DN11885_c0_g1~~TRINITY_DN11885_c0_g1_i1.p4  ORF type:complete len:137 (-),score=24.81 TRINITY_DN11885_c0_g1_i1:660-1070(-)